MAEPSDTRKPANGRINSDGSGIIADSIAIAIIDAEIADGPVERRQERDDDLVDEREHAAHGPRSGNSWPDHGPRQDSRTRRRPSSRATILAA